MQQIGLVGSALAGGGAWRRWSSWSWRPELRR
jgi:hypothetical protein